MPVSLGCPAMTGRIHPAHSCLHASSSHHTYSPAPATQQHSPAQCSRGAARLRPGSGSADRKQTFEAPGTASPQRLTPLSHPGHHPGLKAWQFLDEESPSGLTWVLCHESGELSLSRLLARPPCTLELCLSFTEVLRGRHSCLLSALLRRRSRRGKTVEAISSPPTPSQLREPV